MTGETFEQIMDLARRESVLPQLPYFLGWGVQLILDDDVQAPAIHGGTDNEFGRPHVRLSNGDYEDLRARLDAAEKL